MRSGYVRKLESGNWYVVEYVDRKHEVLLDAAAENFKAPQPAVAFATKYHETGGTLTLCAGQKKHGLPYYEWSLE